MLLVRRQHETEADSDNATRDAVPDLTQVEPSVVQGTPTLEQSVRDLHTAGRSQRSISRDLNIDRRKVRRILDT
jgi:hypothetical protein